MAYASGADLSIARSRGPWRSRAAVVVSWTVTVFAVLGAASRVTAALENRKQPAAADLEILGIEGPVPLPR